MLNKNDIVKVTNRDNGTVGYSIPDLGNLRRSFQKGETKEITMDELRKLSFLPGGIDLIQECFIIQNEEALRELLSDVEPEYFYTKQDIEKLLLTGTIEQLMDCLDFAPIGVIDLVKDLAVELKINDIAKREVILEKTGFNVTKAIDINKETEENDIPTEKRRRAEPIKSTTDTTPKRRTTPPQYKVVSK